MQNINLIIMTSSNRNPSWQYIQSLDVMMEYVKTKGINGIHLSYLGKIQCTQSSCLPVGRQLLLDMAIDRASNSLSKDSNQNWYGLFIDDDMAFPSNILDVMFGNIQYSLVASSPSKLNPIKALGTNYLRKDQSKAIYTATDIGGGDLDSINMNGVSRCLACGLGFFIIDLSVFLSNTPPPGCVTRIPDDMKITDYQFRKLIPKPHFEIVWHELKNDYISEDLYFTAKLGVNGVPVYIDHDASKLVSHIGDFRYNYDSMGKL